MTHRNAIVLAAALLLGARVPADILVIDGAKPRWSDRFGTARTDWTNRFVELRDGTLVSAGFVNRDDQNSSADWDMMVRRYRANGRLLWSRRIGGPLLDAAWSVTELPDGRLAMSGFSAAGGAGGTDASLTMLDHAGNGLTQTRYGGPGDDRATDLVQLAGGDLLLVGQTDMREAKGIEVLLVRTDSAGKEEWRRTFGTATDDRGFYGIPMPDGGAVIAGVTGPRGAYDLLLMRIDGAGREVWRRTAGGPGNDATHGLALMPNGQIVVAGYGASWGGQENDVSLLVYTANGELLSHQAIGGTGDDRVQYVAAAPDGSLWFTGYTKSFSDEWRLLVGRTGKDGTIEPWLATLSGPGNVNGSTISLASNGDLLLGGYAVPARGKAPDAFVLRVAPARLVRRTEGVAVRTIPVGALGAR